LETRVGYTVAVLEQDLAANDVKELTYRWMRLRAAQLLLQRAVEHYRRANEGPLLKRAGEIFSAIVKDRLPDDFIGIESLYEDQDNPIIVARRRNGSLCAVEK